MLPTRSVPGRCARSSTRFLGFINAHINNPTNVHAASALSYAGGGNWADGTTNPAATVEGQLDKIVADLSALTGAPKVGAAAASGAPNSLSPGSVRSQLDALLGFINGHINLGTNAHAAAAIAYAGGGNWADGTTNPPTTVENQLDKVVADLVTDGAARIGASASGNLSPGTVRSQLDELDATSVRTNVANTFTASQTLNGATGDTSAALITTETPSIRKLLWEVQAGGLMKVRFYASIDGSWEVTCNAAWDGTQWVRDQFGNNASQLRMDRFNFTLRRKLPSGNFADGTWDGSWDINLPTNGLNSWNTDDWFGNGQTTSYAAIQAQESDNGNLGSGCTWKHRFSATPSSITFATQSTLGVASGPFAFAQSNIGTGVFVGGAAGTTWFYTHVTAS